MKLWARVKRFFTGFAAMREEILCSLGLRTCRQCRALQLAQKQSLRHEQRSRS